MDEDTSVELTELEEREVDLGRDAQSLLDSHAFLNAIESIRAQCAEAILTSPPSATAAREDSYHLSRGLSAVTAELLALQERAGSILENAKLNTARIQGVSPDAERDDY
jgi:hypothetical protein